MWDTAGMVQGGSCLSVVMPSYNEAATLETVIGQVLASPYVQELIVVDDGSTDDTVAIVESIDDPRIRLFVQPINLGKGAALRRGFAGGDRAVRHRPGRRPRVRPGGVRDGARRRSSPATPTSSTARGSSPVTPHRVLYYWHSVGNRFLTTASNMFTNLNLTDMETCYKAFRREVIQSIEIEEDRFGFEPEITAKIAAAGWRIYEVGISYSGRTYSEGKKIGWKDGVRAIYGVVRYSNAWQRRALGRSTTRRTAASRRPSSTTPTPSSPTCCRTLEDADNYADWIYRLIRAAPRRATCSRSAPVTVSSPSACAATRGSPRPTSRSVASTSSRCGSTAATTSRCSRPTSRRSAPRAARSTRSC